MVTILVRSESETDLGVQYVLHPNETMIRVYNDYAARIGYPAQDISIRRRLLKFPIIHVTVRELEIKNGEVFTVVGLVGFHY